MRAPYQRCSYTPGRICLFCLYRHPSFIALYTRYARIADLEQLRFYGANEITFPFKIWWALFVNETSSISEYSDEIADRVRTCISYRIYLLRDITRRYSPRPVAFITVYSLREIVNICRATPSPSTHHRRRAIDLKLSSLPPLRSFMIHGTARLYIASLTLFLKWNFLYYSLFHLANII